MSAVFLCFAEADRDIAERLASALDDAGIRLWRANGALVAAESAAANPAFDPKPDAMAALLAIWTPAARQSPWVRDLTRSALGFAKLINVNAGLAAVPFPYDRAATHALDGWLADGDLDDLERDLRSRLADAEAAESPNPFAMAPEPEVAPASAVTAPDAGEEERHEAPASPGAAVTAEPPIAAPVSAPTPDALGSILAGPYRASAPRRPGRGPLWAAAAVAVVGALAVGGYWVLGHRHAAPPAAPIASEAVIDDGAAAAPDLASVKPLAQAAVGRWATRANGCERSAEISVSDGQLTLREPDGAVETGVIMADTADTFAVQGGAGAVTYTVAGNVLTRSGGADGAVSFIRCPGAPARHAAPD